MRNSEPIPHNSGEVSRVAKAIFAVGGLALTFANACIVYRSIKSASPTDALSGSIGTVIGMGMTHIGYEAGSTAHQ